MCNNSGSINICINLVPNILNCHFITKLLNNLYYNNSNIVYQGLVV